MPANLSTSLVSRRTFADIGWHWPWFHTQRSVTPYRVRFRSLHQTSTFMFDLDLDWRERCGSRCHGLLGRRADVARGRRARYVLRTLDSEVHPSCIHGLKHLLGRSGVAFRDAELLERFRPPCARDRKGFHVKIQDFAQLLRDFIRGDRDFRSFRTDRVIDAIYLDEKYPERRDLLRARWRRSLVWEQPQDI